MVGPCVCGFSVTDPVNCLDYLEVGGEDHDAWYDEAQQVDVHHVRYLH